jgi:hypothetical protein
MSDPKKDVLEMVFSGLRRRVTEALDAHPEWLDNILTTERADFIVRWNRLDRNGKVRVAQRVAMTFASGRATSEQFTELVFYELERAERGQL